MDDTSLEDFLGADGNGDDDSEPDRSGPVEPDDATTPEQTTPQPDDAGVAPATPTSRWVGAEVACAVCGAATERVWESANGLVCGACKEW